MISLLSNALFRAASIGTLSEPGGSLIDFFGGGPTGSGVQVSLQSAMAHGSVWACVRVISETMASLPLALIQVEGRKRKRLTAHPALMVMKYPHPEHTDFEFRELMMNHTCYRGQAFAQKVYDNGGRLKMLNPLDPSCVTVERELLPSGRKGQLLYRVILPHSQQMVTLTEEDIFHFRGPSWDGVNGLSPIGVHRETIGAGLAAQSYGARFFGNSARPGGVIQAPNRLSDSAFKHMKDSWEEAHKGVNNSHKVALLEEGATWSKVGMTNDEAQFIETMKYDAVRVCRIFRVPPHKIGDLERATFSNIEQQDIQFYKDCMLAWIVRLERRFDHSFLTPEERAAGLCFKFNANAMLRAATKERYDAYKIGRDGGWLSANDIREMEDDDPIEGGDEYFVPLNMVKAGAEVTDTLPAPDPAKREAFTPLITSVLERVLRKEERHLGDLMARPAPAKAVEDFYQRSHRKLLTETFAPMCRTLDQVLPRPDGKRNVDTLVESYIVASTVLISGAMAREVFDARAFLENWTAERLPSLLEIIL